MIKSFRYLKPYIGSVILIFTLIAIRARLLLLLPEYLGELIDIVSNTTLSQAERTEGMVYYGGLMIGATILSIVVIVISSFLESRTSSAFAKTLRLEVYKKVQSFSMTEMDKFTTSSLITRTTNDINSLQNTINMLLRMVVMAPFMAIGAIIMAVNTNPTISTVLIFSIITILAVITAIWLTAFPKFKIIQRLVDKLNLVTRENLSGLRVVRAFNTQNVQAHKTKLVAEESMEKSIFVNRVFNLMWPVMGLVQQLTTVAMYYVAIHYGIIQPSSEFTPGDLSAIIQYGTTTLMNFMMLTFIITMIPRASISAKRVMDVIDQDLLIKDPDEPKTLEHVEGEIEFRNVTFKYPNSEEPVLKNINFVARKNQMTAFIGSTGSGKSTLINLIPRFYDVTEGEILLDGVDIREYSRKDYLKHIGFVPQKANLFKGTIETNIAFGQDEIDEEVVKKAAEIAQAKSFIEKFDHQYQSAISQGGTNVSGGQRQRLSIARAIAKQPKIYIFDDSFSALDYQTDKKLRKELKKHINSTMLVVAQRINTIRHADQIVVLDKGEVVGIGTHAELMKTCRVYQEIAESQLSKEELGNE